MSEIQQSLSVAWIYRLGSRRVAELAEGLGVGPTIGERAVAIVDHLNSQALDEVIMDGFQRFFHQSAYIRQADNGGLNVKALAGLNISDSSEDVGVRSVRVMGARTRALLMVAREMEFLPPDGAPFSEIIDFPVVVEADGSRLAIHVITMQSNVDSWSGIVGNGVRKLITPVSADRTHDQILNFLSGTDSIDIGHYHDFSGPALELAQHQSVDTFSGQFEVGSRGQSQHETIGGLARQPLREEMSEEFEQLLAANRIVRLEVRFTEDHRFMAEGSRLLLHPTAGKVVARANLKGGDIHAFIGSLA